MSENEPRASDRPIRVLHVDDEPEFAEMAAHYLERDDDRLIVETARSAEAGLDRLDETSFDCVVSDYDMPGLNGIEFLDAVRAEAPDLPFVLFTGKGSEEIASEAISAGVTDYLQKGGGSEQYTLLANRVRNAVESDRSRKGAERRKRRLETLISNLPGVVYRCRNDPQWTMEQVEGECEKLTGYSASAMESGEVLRGEDLIHPDDADELWEPVQTALDADNSFEVTYRIVTRDGETRWMWERGREVDTGDDEAAFLEGFITDITEARGREAELERANALRGTLFDALPVGVLAEDADREVMAANERFLDLFGISGTPESVVGADCTELAEEVRDLFDDPTRFVERTEELVARRDTVADERLGLSDGRTFERSHRPIELPEGDGHLWVYRDVTERTEREAQLRRRNERLDEFTRVVSHDLRNPIGVAKGHLELATIEGEEAGEGAGTHLAAARRAVDRMDTLVEDLLTLARKGEAVTEPEPTALPTLAEESWQTVETGDAELSVEGNRTVLADRGRAKQLLENLFRNAVEHGSTNGPGTTVTVGATTEGFYVADDGPGIPQEKRTRVLDPGYTTGGGTGFGLAIVERLADAHGWHVSVCESETGGARFEFSGVDAE